MTDCKFELNDELLFALNRLHDYLLATTGKPAESHELSKVLGRYFILSEIGAQLKWERDNPDY